MQVGIFLGKTADERSSFTKRWVAGKSVWLTVRNWLNQIIHLNLTIHTQQHAYAHSTLSRMSSTHAGVKTNINL